MVETDEVWAAIDDPKKHVIIQTAPSVRATLGESFGMPIGTNVEGKMAAALRRLGFDGVYDTDFGADMTIMEEAAEFMERLKTGERLPIITSCCPGWVKYCEEFYTEFIPNLSSCKSPQQMFGALAKTYYAEKNGLDPKNIEMPKASRTAPRVGATVSVVSMALVMTTEAADDRIYPSRIPMTPPRALVAAASMTNCCMM